MKFLCLIYEDQSTFDQQSPDEWQELRRDVLNYVERLRADGLLLDAQPLQRADRTSVVRVRKGNVSVTDGPFIEAKEVLGGYWLVEAPSKEDVVKWAQRCPADEGDTIEIRQIFGPEDFAE